MIAQIGGIKSAFSPIGDILNPIIILVFLLTLASILQQDYKKDYKNELSLTINEYLSKMPINDKTSELVPKLKESYESI